MRDRRGFALLAVLWVVAVLSTLAGTGVLAARSAGSVSSNRIALARGRWAAEACLAAAQAALDSMLRTGTRLTVPTPITIVFAGGAQCRLDGYEPAARLHPDSATSEMLARFDSALVTYGVPAPRESLLTSEGDGRININTAPPAVLAALPGFGSDAVRAALERRRFGGPITDLYEILGRIPPPARENVMERYGEAVRRITFTPTSIVLVASGRGQDRTPVASIEALVVSAGSRAAIVRSRMW